ncbi:MAG: hypothetical protein ACYCXU_01795 [Thermoleophilia bacterium]
MPLIKRSDYFQRQLVLTVKSITKLNNFVFGYLKGQQPSVHLHLTGSSCVFLYETLAPQQGIAGIRTGARLARGDFSVAHDVIH